MLRCVATATAPPTKTSLSPTENCCYNIMQLRAIHTTNEQMQLTNKKAPSFVIPLRGDPSFCDRRTEECIEELHILVVGYSSKLDPWS